MDRPDPRSEREQALRNVEALLRLEPDSVEHRFGRATLLDGLGKNDTARVAYLDVLRLDPTHEGGLTGLANLLNKSGRRTESLALLLRVVESHPRKSSAHANYATLLTQADDLDAARAHFEHAVRLDPGNAFAHRGLAVVLLRQGEDEMAAHHVVHARSEADIWPFRGEGTPVSILLLWSARGNNVKIEPFVDDRVFQKTTLAVEFWSADKPLPPHDLVFNGMGDADTCARSLVAAEKLLEGSTARVINHPSRVLPTGRAANATRIATIPGVAMARTQLWARDALLAADAPEALVRAGFAWPLLLRSPGLHAGEHFEMVDRPEDLARVVATVPGRELFVLEFIDVRRADGKYRKYRVMTIDGRLYPLHLAVSSRWKIHFFSADMSTSAEHRAEDEAFLNDMPGTLGADTMHKLEQVREALALDYGGIDFAVNAAGRLVVFETNATMSIVQPPRDAMWMYRRAPVERVENAVRAMLLGHAPPAGATP